MEALISIKTFYLPDTRFPSVYVMVVVAVEGDCACRGFKINSCSLMFCTRLWTTVALAFASNFSSRSPQVSQPMRFVATINDTQIVKSDIRAIFEACARTLQLIFSWFKACIYIQSLKKTHIANHITIKSNLMNRYQQVMS